MMEFNEENVVEQGQEQGQVVHKIVIPAAEDDQAKEVSDKDLEQQVWADDADEEAKSEEDDLNDFFVFGDATPKKKSTPAKSASAAKPNASKPKEDKKYGVDYVIAYARERIEVPHDDMTLEQIRAWLEIDFPEFGKERTEMLVDESNKFIVPVIKSPKKG